MSRKKTKVYVHPTDKGKWNFPEGWEIEYTNKVTQGEPQKITYTPPRKNILLAIWEGLILGIRDYFTRRNEWSDKK